MRAKQETEPATEQRTAQTCVHRWLLGELERGAVQGTCRRCGARRAFSAGFEVPPPAPEGEEEQVLDIPALTAAFSSLQTGTLI